MRVAGFSVVSGTQRITYTQEYNAENRLSVVTGTISGEVVRFVCDGDGHRVLRIEGKRTTAYIGDHYERRKSTVCKHYYASDQRIAVWVNGILSYLHGDHLGGATMATEANGNRIGELRYTPYGVTRYE